MSRNSLILCLLLLAFSAKVCAQTPDSTNKSEDKNVRFIALPLVFFLPETSLGFGGAGAVNFRFGEDTTTQSSQVLFGGAYTLFDQVLSYANFNLYPAQGKYWLKGEVGFYRYFYYFYGIGPEAKSANEETYKFTLPRVRLDATRKLNESSFLGFRYWFDQYNISEIDSTGILFNDAPIGQTGGRVSGIGPVFIYDTRDNVYSSRKGYRVELSTLFFEDFIASDYRYLQASLDAVWFTQPWKNLEHVFGVQLLSDNQWGDVPFFSLSQVGSPKMMRGYYRGRYTDKKQIAAQIEYRFPLFWRLEQTVFTSAALIGSDYDRWRIDQAIPAVGSGLRFVVNEDDRIKVRFDVAYGEELNFYLTFNEAF